MQLVGELMGLRPEQLGGAAERPELALEVRQCRAVPQGGHGAEVATVARHTHLVHHQHAASSDHDVVARAVVVGLGALVAEPGQHIEEATFDAQVAQAHARGVLRQVEQPPRDVVDESDPVVRVEGDHALGDAVEQGLTVLGQSGDLVWFESEGLALDAACQQPRSRDAEGQRDAEVGEQVGRRSAEALPRRGEVLGDHHGAQVLADVVIGDAQHRHLAHELPVAVQRERSRPARTGLHRCVTQRHRLVLQRRVGGNPDPFVGVGDGDGRDLRLGDGLQRHGCQPGALLGDGEVVAHQRVGSDLFGQRRDAAPLNPAEGRLGLGQRHCPDAHQDDEDDAQLEEEQLSGQGPPTQSTHDHYELNLLW